MCVEPSQQGLTVFRKLKSFHIAYHANAAPLPVYFSNALHCYVVYVYVYVLYNPT